MRDFIDSLRAQLGANDKNVFDFVLAFSRWEYALKITDGGRYANHSGEPEDTRLGVDWTLWSDAHAPAWRRLRPADLASWEIMKRPPQYQVKSAAGTLEPHDRPAPAHTDLKSVVRLVYALRNNLFHGGKWALRDPARDRDELLLSEGIELLRHFVELDPDLKKEFYELGPTMHPHGPSS